MSFDDRSAYCETHSHAVRLGGEESIEDPIDISWSEAGAGILDRNKYTVIAVELGHNAQLSFSGDNRLHRIESIRGEVQDHLLQLHSIGADKWDIFVQVGLNLNPGIQILTF